MWKGHIENSFLCALVNICFSSAENCWSVGLIQTYSVWRSISCVNMHCAKGLFQLFRKGELILYTPLVLAVREWWAVSAHAAGPTVWEFGILALLPLFFCSTSGTDQSNALFLCWPVRKEREKSRNLNFHNHWCGCMDIGSSSPTGVGTSVGDEIVNLHFKTALSKALQFT